VSIIHNVDLKSVPICEQYKSDNFDYFRNKRWCFAAEDKQVEPDSKYELFVQSRYKSIDAPYPD